MSIYDILDNINTVTNSVLWICSRRLWLCNFYPGANSRRIDWLDNGANVYFFGILPCNATRSTLYAAEYSLSAWKWATSRLILWCVKHLNVSVIVRPGTTRTHYLDTMHVHTVHIYWLNSTGSKNCQSLRNIIEKFSIIAGNSYIYWNNT